jgi:hypothetical protein
MATIKVTLAIDSTDVLPYVLKISESKSISTASDANANIAQSGSLTVSTTAITINTEIDGGIDNRALVYIKNTGAVALAGAVADVNILVSDEGTAVLEIAPGEFAFMPYNGGANSTLTVSTASGTGYCDFFIAELT